MSFLKLIKATVDEAGKNMRGCQRRQKHQRSEPSIHFLIYGVTVSVNVSVCWIVANHQMRILNLANAGECKIKMT